MRVAGPEIVCSSIRTSEPEPCGRTSRITRSEPNGRVFAWSTIRRGGSHSSTCVSSFSTSGHTPIEWCSLVPTAGYPPSAARSREAPTTQVG